MNSYYLPNVCAFCKFCSLIFSYLDYRMAYDKTDYKKLIQFEFKCWAHEKQHQV